VRQGLERPCLVDRATGGVSFAEILDKGGGPSHRPLAEQDVCMLGIGSWIFLVPTQKDTCTTGKLRDSFSRKAPAPLPC
jgi:hypothetical protein